MRAESDFRISQKTAINWKNDDEIIIFRRDFIVKFFGDVVFLLVTSLDTSLVISRSFMSILSLVLDL